MLDELRIQSECISLEAVSGEQAHTQALSRLPKFLAEAKTYLDKTIGEPLTALFSRRSMAGFNKAMASVTYTRLTHYPIHVPMGLKIDLVTYGNLLLKTSQITGKLQEEVLAPFVKWLSQKLADPASLANLRPALEIENYVKRDVDTEIKHLTACFDMAKGESSMPYGKAVRRNADWSEIAALAESVQTVFLKEDHVRVQRAVSETTMLLDTLIKRIQEDPETYKVSPATLVALAKTSYGIAREIEFYGLVRARVIEYVQAVQLASGQVDEYVRREGLVAA